MRWITRERPKIDRVACPWLITRFIDADATFVFAPAANVLALAKSRRAIPYDIDGAVLSHRGDRCSFDAFLDDYKLDDRCLHELADIVRGADTSRLDLAPQAAGLFSISLGLSRLCMGDDHRMLAHGFIVYDALYEWLRYGRTEQHGWNGGKGKTSGEPPWEHLVSEDIDINLASRRVAVGGKRVKLPPKEFALLVALVARAGRVLTRRFLLQHVWTYEADVESRTVDWHVAALRRRLGRAGDSIETVRGEGYRWMTSATEAQPRTTRRPATNPRRSFV
jgi:DNA-binding winged helix-turn-helix (wHTH) protein